MIFVLHFYIYLHAFWTTDIRFSFNLYCILFWPLTVLKIIVKNMTLPEILLSLFLIKISVLIRFDMVLFIKRFVFCEQKCRKES